MLFNILRQSPFIRSAIVRRAIRQTFVELVQDRATQRDSGATEVEDARSVQTERVPLPNSQFLPATSR